MAISTGMAILGAAGIGAAGSALSAASANKAASKAADAQADAATEAARIQAESADKALGFQQGVYADQRGLAAPTTVAGAAARARQMVMAGMSPEEARAYYTDTVKAIQAGARGAPTAIGGAQSASGAAGAGAANDAVTEELLKNNPDFQRNTLAETQNPKSQLYGMSMPDAVQYWIDNLGGSSSPALQAAKEAVQTQQQQKAAAGPAPSATEYGGDIPDLGDLSEWTPQTFSFDTQDVYEDPGYEFRRGEGEKALQRQAAASGKFYSGALGKGLTRYNQDYASGEFDKAYGRSWNEFNLKDTTKWNRLGALSGLASEGTNLITDAGSTFGANAGDITQNAGAAAANGVIAAGNARATGYANQTNPWAAAAGGGLGGALSAYQTTLKYPKLSDVQVRR